MRLTNSKLKTRHVAVIVFGVWQHVTQVDSIRPMHSFIDCFESAVNVTSFSPPSALPPYGLDPSSKQPPSLIISPISSFILRPPPALFLHLFSSRDPTTSKTYTKPAVMVGAQYIGQLARRSFVAIRDQQFDDLPAPVRHVHQMQVEMPTWGVALLAMTVISGVLLICSVSSTQSSSIGEKRRRSNNPINRSATPSTAS